MRTQLTNIATKDLGWAVAMLILVLGAPVAIGLARTRAPENSARAADDVAVKKVVAQFSEGWNMHDAHAMCVSVADDVQWTGRRGDVFHSRQDVEEDHAKLFADLYKNISRVDTVKSIKYFGADLAMVDDYWTMTGARKRDGSDWPYRAGYVSFMMEKRSGRWIVTYIHTADFNAQAPTTK